MASSAHESSSGTPRSSVTTLPYSTFADAERTHLVQSNEDGCVAKDLVANMSRGTELRWSTMSEKEKQLYLELDAVRSIGDEDTSPCASQAKGGWGV